MSTRCQIKIKSDDESVNTVYVYRHHDGYPNGRHGVLALLVPTVDKFRVERGYFDSSYLLARICAAVCNHVPGATGAGIDTVRHGDIEFLYEIDEDWNIYINGEKKTREQIKTLIGAES